jgi:Fic-DOC domain mobile mystery protein B
VDDNPPSGATPLDPDEADDLIPTHITTRGELDELEEANIQEGLQWARRKALGGGRPIDVLTESFLYALHKEMLGSVWSWGGKVRGTDKNIGVDKFVVRAEVRKLVEDARYRRHNGVYDADELAVRFHHRLVSIHPFVNGNGRHARMMADLIAQQAGRPAFSWGGASLTSTSELRSAYVGALRRADDGDLTALLEFARS